MNPVQTEILYGKALEYAGLTGKETVVDAYCGTGTIGMIASDKAGKVIGVELNACLLYTSFWQYWYFIMPLLIGIPILMHLFICLQRINLHCR